MANWSGVLRGSARRDPTLVLPEETLPLPNTLVLGLQHVLAMFGSTVLAPLLMGFDPSLAVFFSGIGTLIFLAVTRGRVPSYLGSSFAFIGPVLAAKTTGGIPGALFGILCAGVVYGLVALVVIVAGTRWIDRLMPPLVTGGVVMAIGLNLANVAGGMFMQSPGLASITLAAAVLIAVYLRGFPRMIPILLGVLVGYMVAAVTGQIDFSHVESAAWIGLPGFVTPAIDWRAAALIAPVAIVLIAENTGHVKAVSGNMGRDLTGMLGLTFLGDAIGTCVSALGGGTGQTTYAENIGVMAMTRVYSILVFVVASAVAILLGFCPKFAALIQSIPVGVMGGISLLLFALIAATGGRIWVQGHVDFSKQRSLIVGGVTMVLGAINIDPKAGTPFAFDIGGFELSGIALATFASIVLYQLLSLRREQDTDRAPAAGAADAEPQAPEAAGVPVHTAGSIPVPQHPHHPPAASRGGGGGG